MSEGREIAASDIETFLRRAAPHFLAGKSVEDSMRAVLDDDARLFNALCTRGTSAYFPTPDECGSSRSTGERTGDVITSHMAAQVYAALRARALTQETAHANVS